MALLDIFKKKETEKKKEKEEKFSEIKVVKERAKKQKEAVKERSEKLGKDVKDRLAGDHPKGGKKKDIAPKVAKKEFSYAAFRVLKSPHVTEKAVNLEAQSKYVFKVALEANKPEIKKAIQELYGIKVEDVNIVNIPRKKRRLGRSEGYKQGYKKAIITVEQGAKIESGI